MTNREIPKGMYISVIVVLVSACLAFMWAFVAIISGRSPETRAHDELLLYAFIVAPFLFLISGIGLLRFKNWARLWSICFLPIIGTSFMYNVYQAFAEVSIHPEWAFSTILMSLILLSVSLTYFWIAFYLTRPHVKSLFK